MGFSEAVKRLAKEKAHYHCVLCKTPYFLDVHHIVPEAEGGPDTIENAAPLCPNCHTWFGHDSAKRGQVRAIRDWWWQRCERIDTAQMTPGGKQFDEMFQAYEKSQAADREKRFDDMKTFIANQFRDHAFQVSSAHTVSELMQASSSSAYGAGAYGAGPYGGGSTCPSCGAGGFDRSTGCMSCGAKGST